MGDSEIEALLRDKYALMHTEARLRAELLRAVREINRLGVHTATVDGCHVCEIVRSFGLPEEMTMVGIEAETPTKKGNSVPKEMSNLTDRLRDGLVSAETIYEAADEIDALRAFAQAVMEVWPMGDLDGGTLQEIATTHGMLKPETRHEPCGEVCSCNEYADPHEWEDGVVCYRKTPLLKGSNA